MTIGQTAATLGVSEKTIRRRIKKGLLNAKLVGEPPHYEIEASEIGFNEELSSQSDDFVQPVSDPEGLSSQSDEFVQPVSDPSGDTTQNKDYRDLLDMLKEQLSEKDGQIKELHILLQAAQEQAGRILTAGGERRRRWWWPFG
ncbi:hypothetical protein FIM04_03040 [SAR202 cluster bacterium AC-409-J13_OGT_754m]|nr:hypothetical protein [SAR202 cluster bacterium AC-409-J13_OGT_754m]